MKKILRAAALLLSTSSVTFAGITDTHEIKITAKVAAATTVSIVDGDVSIDKSQNSMHFDFTGNGETKTQSLDFLITSNKGYDLKLTSTGKLTSTSAHAEMPFTTKIAGREVKGEGNVVYTEDFSTNAQSMPLKLEVTVDSKNAAAADDYEGNVILEIESK